MRRYRTVGIVIVLIIASALAGYEVGANKASWDSSPSQTARANSEQSASDDITFSARFGRVVHEAAEKVDSLAAQLGTHSWSMEWALDRLGRLAVAAINIANVLALLGAICFVATLLMRTIVPLRIAAIVSDVFFVGYAALANSVTTFILYVLLLPINVVRLYQMVKLVKRAREAADGDLSMDWLKPFMTRRKYHKDDVLCRRGDAANEMLYIVTGRFRVMEIGIELGPGRMVGELGFLSPKNRRTQTVGSSPSLMISSWNYISRIPTLDIISCVSAVSACSKTLRVSKRSSSRTKAGWRLVPSDALRAAPFHIFGDGSDRRSGASCRITPSRGSQSSSHALRSSARRVSA
jgi:Cyclic nucleotide-binding domain